MEEDQRFLERILDGAENPRDLPFALLKDITNGFSEDRKIGQGGFGVVYKGVLGERIVAVKRIHMNENTFDDKLFRREVESLMSINHRYVVQFLGVCSVGYHKLVDKDGSGEIIWADVPERLLCFRYISNGSLDRHITDELRGLEWDARYEIITGICKGLLYLHKEKNIIHMDLKPANILLDCQDEKYMVPKIMDFGLSRSNKNSHSLGQRYGTLEYMAPEYREESKTTQSCDIYSLGLIIIELVTGCKDVPNKDNVLRRWRHRWQKPPTQLQYQQVTRCIDIAGQCRRKNPKDRPSIRKIINFLSQSEYTCSQISPFLDEDDMLRINPLEVRLPFALKNEMPCTIELINETRNCIIAFNIQIPSTMYNAQPDKGIVRPESKYSVKITVKARDDERDHADKFIVQSMKVEASEGLGDEDIIERMFEKAGRFIDEVDLMVVYESMKPQENFKRSEDTKAPAEEVPETKNCEYLSGSSGKAEEASMSLPTPTKSGPRGGTGGRICDTEEKPWRLTSLTIFCRGIIYAFSFSYIDQSGKKHHVGPWGTDDSNQKTETICFGPSEFVEEVSGTYGSYRGIIRVASLTFVTNVKTYGPFGNPYQRDLVVRTHFRFMADDGSSIVGFHGRSGSYIDAIGVYMFPSNRTIVGPISPPMILDRQRLSNPTKSGSWGGSGGGAHDISEKPWRLTSLTVSYKGLIDAFSFSYIDQAGKKQNVGPWGEGYHDDKIETIRFGPSEFVKEVSGAYGDHHGSIIVKFLTFVTNVGTYGPFGTPDHPGPVVSATHFRFMADEGSSIVGFYGRSGRYINAIGVYTARVAEL